MSILKKILPFFLCGLFPFLTACSLGSSADRSSETGINSPTETSDGASGETGDSAGSNSNSAGDKTSSDSAGNDSTGNETSVLPEPVEYTQEVREEAKRVVISLVETHLQEAGSSLTAAQKQKMNGYMDEYVIPVFEREGISEIQFYLLVRALESRGQGVVATLFSLYSGEGMTGEQYREMVALYADFANYLGGNVLAGTVYELSIEWHNYKIADYRSKYERTGYGYYLDYIAEEEENKAVLSDEIGRKNFTALLKVGMELLEKSNGIFSDKEEVTDETAYSDSEILAFLVLSGYQLQDLNITEKGWAACLRILGNFLDEIKKEDSGMGMGMLSVLLSEDYAAAGGVADKAVSLFSSAAMALQDGDIAFLRRKDFIGLLSAVCARFSAEEWTLLQAVCEVDLQAEKYVAHIREEGKEEEYRAYCAAMQTVDFDEWRRAVGTENFNAATEKFLCGKFPWLAFVLFGGES